MNPTDEQYGRGVLDIERLPETGLPLEIIALIAVLVILSGIALNVLARKKF